MLKSHLTVNSMFSDKYLASRPIGLRFAGWETDTYKLQQAGWQLSAVQDYMYNAVQIAFSHPEYRIRGISSKFQSPLFDQLARYDFNDSIVISSMMGSDFISNVMTVASFDKFRPIDAEPQFMTVNQYMSENVLFAPNLARTQEIIIPEQSVDDLLNSILDKQASNRAELIRKRVRQQGDRIDNFNPRTHVHAQIVSIAA